MSPSSGRLVPSATLVAGIAVLLAACGGAAAAGGAHPSLAQLWRECQRTATDEGDEPGDPHVYTCTYRGARYELPERGTPDIIDVDADHVSYADTAYERVAPYVVVRGLEGHDRVTPAAVAPGRAAVGDAALMLFGLATRGNAGAAPQPTTTEESSGEATPETNAAAPAELPFASRTERVSMAPGLTALVLVRHHGRDRVLRIVSEPQFDFLLGVSASIDLTPLPDRPFGQVTLGDPLVAGGTERALQFSQDPVYAVSAHALLGIRLQDTALWLGTPILSTTGGPFSGVELHVGQRFRSFSQAMYFGLYGALRWSNRPRTAGFTGNDSIEHLPRDWQYSLTVGVELQFDLLTLAGGRDGFVNAFASD